MYRHYRPLRNLLRQFELIESLAHVWQLSRHLCSNGTSPYPGRMLRGQVHPWEVALLARELILNAGRDRTQTLGRYDTLAKVVNCIRKVEEDIHKVVINEHTVLDEMMAIAHRQFHWQQASAYRAVVRYLRLYRQPALARLVQEVMGLDVTAIFRMGVVVGGTLQRSPVLDTRRDLGVAGITPADVARFYAPLTIGIDELRERMRSQEPCDRNWAYQWNPLEATPFIVLDPRRPHLLLCPIHEYQLRAFSHGIYYRLYNAKDFDNTFGPAFEALIGDVLHRVCPGPMYHVQGEQAYMVGKHRKHGTDWIVHDASANLFIECKTKRLSLPAKLAGNRIAIDNQLATLARALVQLYKNVEDAKTGKARNWRPNGLPIYPVLVTLEEWHLFSPNVWQRLDAQIRAGLQVEGITVAVLEDMPYTIASAEDFESALQTAAAIGLAAFFRGKTARDHAHWTMCAYVAHGHGAVAQRVHEGLFLDDLQGLFPREVGVD